ncbi:FtsK/SpoIIIE domain-containing protein [Catenulispora yoronensis]
MGGRARAPRTAGAARAPRTTRAARAPPRLAESADVDLATLLKLTRDLPIDPKTLWRQRTFRNLLRIPIGVDGAGNPLLLNLKDAARGGDGPHGLCVGPFERTALLRTIVLSLALTHSPDDVNFLLVDSRPGTRFSELEPLPHVTAVLRNVADTTTLLDRIAESISGELLRRQTVLTQAGNYGSAAEYEGARRQGASLEPLPALLIVFDDAGELLGLQPDFIDLFGMIDRMGRLLGVHLLLSLSRFEADRLGPLDERLTYRIASGMSSAAESRAVIGVPDAHQLRDPGLAYVRRRQADPILFRGARTDRTRRPRPAFSLDDLKRSGHVTAAERQPAFIEEAIAALKGHGRPAHRIWLPPLGDPPPWTC